MTAFVSTPPLLSRRPVADPRHRQSPAVAPTLSPCRMRAPSQPPPPISRRALLCGATATALASLILPADAKVDIDIERFGDKGLLLSCLFPLFDSSRCAHTD